MLPMACPRRRRLASPRVLPGLRWRALALLLSVALLFACAAPPPVADREILASAESEVVLVLPLNVTAVMPPELERGSRLVWDELTAYLKDHGRQLKTVDPVTARRLWLESVRKAREGERGVRAGFDEAGELFVQELGRHAEFGLVVSPSLAVRQALLSGRDAHWDGVSRPVEFVAATRDAQALARRTTVDGGAPASSLHVVVFDRAGQKVQEQLRGVDLLVRIRVVASAGGAHVELLDQVPRLDPFENYEALQDGIREALAPFLPPASAVKP